MIYNFFFNEEKIFKFNYVNKQKIFSFVIKINLLTFSDTRKKIIVYIYTYVKLIIYLRPY